MPAADKLGALMGTVRFNHPADAVAFRNETEWVYWRDPETGRQRHRRRDKPPTYALRCFVLARMAKAFHRHARFHPSLGRLGHGELRRRVRRVLSRSAWGFSREDERVAIPGWSSLWELSRGEESMLKEEGGGAWRSYVQRGHWRMLLPFARAGQEREARRLAMEAEHGAAPVVHVVTFPALTINHAVVVVEAREDGGKIRFGCYDPNEPETLLEMDFDLGRRSFVLPPTTYFVGGPVNVYEVYRNLWL